MKKIVPTYTQIQDEYNRLYGTGQLSSCWIADAKRTFGLPVRCAWNRRNLSGTLKPCPKYIRGRLYTVLQSLGA